MPSSHTALRLFAVTLGIASAAPAAAAQSPAAFPLCIVEGGALKTVTAQYRPATRDTVVEGQPLAVRLPASRFAPARDWYQQTDIIEHQSRSYLRYGRPRALRVGDVRLLFHWTGVPVFVEASDAGRKAEILYVAVGPACVFQPYQEASADDMYASGLDAYRQGDFVRARASVERETQRAHGPSLVLRGDMLMDSQGGLRRDTSVARRLYREALAAGDPDAYFGFGRIAAVAGNPAAADSLYREASAHGSGIGAAAIATTYLRQEAVPASVVEGVRLVRLALDRLPGSSPLVAPLRAQLSRLYAGGAHVVRDASDRFVQDESAAERGDPLAQYLMGRRYEMGWAVVPNREVAIGYYTASGGAGRHADAAAALQRLGAPVP